MTETIIIMQRLDALQSAVQLLTQTLGGRLTREQLCARRAIHRNSLGELVERGIVPRPDCKGRFFMDEVLEYEVRERQLKSATI